MPFAPPRSVLLLLASLGAACSAEEQPAQFTAADSAGVRVVSHETLDDLPLRSFAADTPEVRLGSAMGDPAEVLDRVTAGWVLPDGQMILLHTGTTQVRFYDSTGALIAIQGQEGQGPGEYVFPSALFVTRGDSLLVWDAGLARASLLSPDGQFIRGIALSGQLVSPRVAGTFADGSLVVVDATLDLEMGSSIQTQIGKDLSYSNEGEFEDSLGSYPGRSAQLMKDGQPVTQFGPEDMVQIRPVAFSGETQRAVTGNGYWIGTTKARELEFHDTSGALKTITRWPGGSLDVTEADKDAYVHERVSQAPSDEAQTAIRAAGVDGFEFAPTLPAHGPLLIDAAGNLWVSDFVRPENFDPVRWTVFGPDGAATAQVGLPSYATLLWAGTDKVLVRITDEIGIEYVELWKLGPVG